MEDKIKIVDNLSPSFPQPSTSRIVCHVCQHQFAHYMCPRCNARYCSIHCYKGHGRHCVDSFMRDNAISEMQQIRCDDESRKRMMNILTRCYSEEFDIMDDDHSFGEESTISEELVEKVLSGSEVRIEELSSIEKKLFQRAISSGELGKMLKPWKPWWSNHNSGNISLSSDGTRLVKPISNTDEEIENNDISEPPPGPDTPLRPTGELTLVKPSPFLPIHLIDILYGYCFTLRLYNGDWRSDPRGSSATVTAMSSVLGDKGRLETVKEAVYKWLERACSSEWRDVGGLGFGVSVAADVARVVGMGRGAVVCSLCEVERILCRGGGRRRRRRRRKVYFMMCWAWEQMTETWNSLASVVTDEIDSVVGFCCDHGSSNISSPRRTAREPLIQEVQFS